MGNNLLERVKWEGNAKSMFMYIMNKIPRFFQGSFISQVNSYIEKNKITVITEDEIIKQLETMAPKAFKDSIMPAIKKMKSK